MFSFGGRSHVIAFFLSTILVFFVFLEQVTRIANVRVNSKIHFRWVKQRERLKCFDRHTLLNNPKFDFTSRNLLNEDVFCTGEFAENFTRGLTSAAEAYLTEEKCKKFRGDIPDNATIRFGVARRLRCSGNHDNPAFAKEVSGALIISPRYKIIYVPNMKVASQMFRVVMERRFNGIVISQNSLKKFLLERNHSLTDYFVFTFVREPLGHFVSAYAEFDRRASAAATKLSSKCLVSRALLSDEFEVAKRGFLKIRREISAEPKRALEAVDNILSGQFQGLTPSHMYSQFWKISRCISNNKLPIVFNFIGKLEQLDKDWKAIENYLGLKHLPLPKIHAAKTDAKVHAQKIDFKNDKYAVLRKRICSYYDADYACFAYKKPSACI